MKPRQAIPHNTLHCQKTREPRQIIPLKLHTAPKRKKQDNDKTKTNNTTQQPILQQNEMNKIMIKPRQIIPLNTLH